jgi:hypothetical protein
MFIIDCIIILMYIIFMIFDVDFVLTKVLVWLSLKLSVRLAVLWILSALLLESL